MNKSIKERAKRVREEIRKTQEMFGISLGLNRTSITDIERGKTFPNPIYLENIHKKYQINLNWLICGSGKMKLDSQSNIIEEPLADYNNYKNKYIDALEKIESLNNEILKLKDNLHWYEVNCKCK